MEAVDALGKAGADAASGDRWCAVDQRQESMGRWEAILLAGWEKLWRPNESYGRMWC